MKPATAYSNLPPRNFWRSGIAEASDAHFPDLFHPKFPIDRSMKIATAGSCFAQHVGRHLRSNGFTIIDAEPAPPGLVGEAARNFGYEMYSARHGNIYFVRQLLQLTKEASNRFTHGDPIWTRDGRFYDALRPTVEPTGLVSEEAVRRQRAAHLRRFRQVLKEADVFVFTMGMIEGWVHEPSGTVYPIAPGVVADSAVPEEMKLHTFDFTEIRDDLVQFIRLLQRANPKCKVLLTVSPVAITATANDEHILVASTYTKSMLRAVAGSVVKMFDHVDYFPGYEIVATHPTNGRFYAPNRRQVLPEGVACVMRHLTAAYGLTEEGSATESDALPAQTRSEYELTGSAKVKDNGDIEEEVACDEILLENYATTAA